MIKFEVFAARIKSILSNPQANPKAALLLLGMIGVLALIVILISFILYSLTKDGQKTEAKKTFSLKKSLILLSITGLSFVALSYTGSNYISKSSFCSKCHIMRPSVTSWRSSTHKRIACIKCHQKKQYFGKLEFTATRIEELIYNRQHKTKQNAFAEISDKNCVNCHEKSINKPVTYKGIKVAHSHFSDVFKCSDCHNAGHKRKEPRFVEELCLGCHRNQKKSNKCSFCHSQDVGKHIVSPSRDFKKVQYGGLTTCEGCHSTQICKNCHGVELPHPPNWKRPEQHAKYAVFDKKNKICKKCHMIPDFCNRCHRFPGHYLTWDKDHQNKNKNWCPACHRTKDMCALCHIQKNNKVIGLIVKNH